MRPREFFRRLAFLFRRSKHLEEMNEELRLHADLRARALEENGMAPESAALAARRKLGNRTAFQESAWDIWSFAFLENAWRDLRFAIRVLRASPGFALVAVLTLSLGIGATTAMFTVLNGVILEPLPYPQPNRLVGLHETTEQYGNVWAFAFLNFLDCQRESRTLYPMAAWRYGGGIVSEPGEADFVSSRQISASLFSVFGVRLLRGRAVLPGEDRPGGTPVAIIR